MSDHRSNMSTGELRGEANKLLREAREACHRPLFDEVVSYRQRIEENASGKKRRKRNKDGRRWVELLADASTLVSFMTKDEHREMYRYAAILLLAYLLPSSTGNDYFTNQWKSPTKVMDSTTGDEFIDMDLLERLENCTATYDSHSFGEIGCCSDETVSSCFRNFLHKGLAPFLARRAAPEDEVDLLHLMAMAISPVVALLDAADENNGKKSTPQVKQTKLYNKIQTLSNCLHSNYFHVNYGDRVEIVRLVAEKLVLPEFETAGEWEGSNCPLFHGAIPHLRAALKAFALGAMSRTHEYWAHAALVNIVVQAAQEDCLNEEWDALVKRTLHDFTDYKCKCSQSSFQHSVGKLSPVLMTTEDTKDRDSMFCTHSARAFLMAHFIGRYNESRHYADETFTRRALSTLASCLQEQLGVIMEANSAYETRTDNALKHAPCQVRSLLIAARTLFYFLLVPVTTDINYEGINGQFDDAAAGDGKVNSDAQIAQGSDDDAGDSERNEEVQDRDMLLRCAVQLLYHPEVMVVREASSVLVIGMAYACTRSGAEFYDDVLEGIRLAWEAPKWKEESQACQPSIFDFACAIDGVVTTICRQSKAFADELVDIVLADAEKTQNDANRAKAILRMLSAVALASPSTLGKHLASSRQLLMNQTDSQLSATYVATIFSFRLSLFFAPNDTHVAELAMDPFLDQIKDPWLLYKLAGHALVTGNYTDAKHQYQRLCCLTTSDRHFPWLRALERTASAEELLAEKGALAIPSAAPQVRSALSLLHSLSGIKTEVDTFSSFSFQMECLRNRLDFLDLCITVRGLCMEMRLTGIPAKRNTRSALHQRNCDKCCHLLAARFYKLYQRNGLMLCQQSRSALRTLSAMCRFLGDASSSIFSESLQVSKAKRLQDQTTPVSWPTGDKCHPMTILLEKYRKLGIETMKESVDPMSRGASLVQVLDGLLKCPLPFPRAILSPRKAQPVATLRLAGDPQQIDEISTEVATGSITDTSEKDNNESEDAEVVEALLGIPSTISAIGQIPSSYLTKSGLAINQVIAWLKVSYDGPLHTEEDNITEVASLDGSQKDETPHESEGGYNDIVSHCQAPLLPDGHFSLLLECPPQNEEGFYQVEVVLGCRDIRFGEWEIPTPASKSVIFLRVAH